MLQGVHPPEGNSSFLGPFIYTASLPCLRFFFWNNNQIRLFCLAEDITVFAILYHPAAFWNLNLKREKKNKIEKVPEKLVEKKVN